MTSWPQHDVLNDTIESIAYELSILTSEGVVPADPEELTDPYLEEVRIRVRAFLVLCSSEIEEFVESHCLDYVAYWAQAKNGRMQHHCFHALTIYFRNNISNLLEKQDSFVDFYATPEQVRRMKANDKKSSSGENESPALNKVTLISKVSVWYRDNVVRASHGVSDSDLCRLLEPLGFSKGLVREECPTLVAALSSLAAGRGEAAHRSTRAGKYPFESLPSPVHQQMSIGDAWARWLSVRDSLYELQDLLDRGSQSALVYQGVRVAESGAQL
ncbi:hypothetical protein OG943_10055 [Amycolatopsis sp. NBC_00345]|uniref:hypothetical protein n=1 Tax=Amycolatopsis sp. NBC_00345 TaxID=2975955 RepID=UPI002E263E6B